MVIVDCGTAAGYRRHYRRGTKPCQPCLRAYREQRSRGGEATVSQKKMEERRAEAEVLMREINRRDSVRKS